MKLSKLIAFMRAHNIDITVQNKTGDDVELKNISLDSRIVQNGDLFVAYKGESVDSRDYISDVIDANVAAILYENNDIASFKTSGILAEQPGCSETERDSTHLVFAANSTHQDDIAENSNTVVIRVKNLKSHLGIIISYFYGEPSKNLKIYAVTGTNGKTTCSYLLAQLLYLLNPCEDVGIVGTVGYGQMKLLNSGQGFKSLANTTPGSLELNRLFADANSKNIVRFCMEASSHALQQGRLEGVNINTAIYTNLSHEHLDYHGSMSEYFKAKLRLFEFTSLENIIVNADDYYGGVLIDNLLSRPDYIKNKTVVIYGCDLENILKYNLPYIHCTNEDLLSIYMPGFDDVEVHSLNTKLIGKFNKYNIMAVIAAAIADGNPVAQVVEQCKNLKPAPGRMEVYCHKSKNIELIVDYAHTPDALEKALQALQDERQASRKTYNIWCVFGCGGDRDKSKRSVMGHISSQYADKIIITNDNPRTETPEDIIRDIRKGIEIDAQDKVIDIITDRKLAIKQALDKATAGDRILIAGKGHEDYQIIGHNKVDYDERGFVEGLVEND